MKRLIIACISLAVCMAVAMAAAHFVKAKDLVRVYEYDSEEAAVEAGIEDIARQWAEMEMSPERAENAEIIVNAGDVAGNAAADGEAGSANGTTSVISGVLAEGSKWGTKYHLIYIENTDPADIEEELAFYLAETGKKNGKYYFERVSTFNGVLSEWTENKDKSDCLLDSTTDVSKYELVYHVIKLADGETAYVDGREYKVSDTVTTESGLHLFGVIDNDWLSIEFK